jgi:hypothetical protein
MCGKSRRVTYALKNDGVAETIAGIQRVMPYAARRLYSALSWSSPIQTCFVANAILVPMPRSTPLVAGALWPTKRLCEEMMGAGLASECRTLLDRAYAITKSAWAGSGQRPDAQQHYDSLAVRAVDLISLVGRRVIIVDDVITRGATMVGAFQRLREVCPPSTDIRCFALIRSMGSDEITEIINPIAGSITTGFTGSFRRP